MMSNVPIKIEFLLRTGKGVVLDKKIYEVTVKEALPKKENINNNISENINEINNNSNNNVNNSNKNDISVDAKPITTQKAKQPATQKQIDYINDLLAKHQKTFENVQELTIKQASILIYQLKNNLELKIYRRRAKI